MAQKRLNWCLIGTLYAAGTEPATIADRDGASPPVVREVVRIALGDCADVGEEQQFAPRFCGEDGSPDGCGSHSLIASWYPYRLSLPHIAAALAQHLGRQRGWVFRIE